VKCKICGNKVKKKNRAFCSERCQMIDLYNWICGDYKISEILPIEDNEKLEN
jgi:endogenous inhibitor of DNA gyrase (YacG/DUF329 family)